MESQILPHHGSDANDDDGARSRRKAVRRMGRERLIRYVHDIIKKQKAPLHDIVRDHALHYLPAQSLLRFRSVSASWNRHISSPFFAHTQSHSHRSISGLFCRSTDNAFPLYLPFDPNSHHVPDLTLSFLPESVLVKSSSNGLICSRAVGAHRYYICNPATTEWTTLPNPLHADRSTDVALVFHPSPLNFSADYHLICAVESTECRFHIYSSSFRRWWKSTVVVESLESDGLVPYSSVSVSGVAYWRTKSGSVVSYDPANDVFCDLGSVPPETGKEPRWQLGEMDGRLCCVSAVEGTVTVYVMEKLRLWTKKRSVVMVGDPWPLIVEGRGDQVAVMVRGMVVGIDVRSGMERVLLDFLPCSCNDDYVPYISSLVSLRKEVPLGATLLEISRERGK